MYPQVSHGDLSTVSRSGNLFWPRVLVEGSEDYSGSGRNQGHIECTDPIDVSAPPTTARRVHC